MAERPRESRSFDPEEAGRAKIRLLQRVGELGQLDPTMGDYVSKARIALDNARATVRDVFGAASDESRDFVEALLSIDPYYSKYEDPSLGDRRAAAARAQEAVARVQNLIQVVDEKTVTGGVGVAPTTTTAPITRRRAGGAAAVKLFITWSGELSHRIALHLKEWLPAVLPFVEPWVSSEDIPKGRRWGVELASQLEGTNSGIVCLVPGNIDEPWLNFEAGALSKSVEKARVHPFLLSPAPVRLDGPLEQFQATRFNKDDVKKLVKAINAEAGPAALPAERVDRSFEVCWLDLEHRLTPLLAEADASSAGGRTGSGPREEPAADALTDEDIKMLKAIANARDGLNRNEAATLLRIHPQRAQHIMERLESRKLLDAAHNYVYGTAWHLSEFGRTFLVKEGLL
jgi:hypothetical protein